MFRLFNRTKKVTPITNFDLIKSMTVNELADFIQNKEYCSRCVWGQWSEEYGYWICGLSRKFEDDCEDGCARWLEQKML